MDSGLLLQCHPDIRSYTLGWFRVLDLGFRLQVIWAYVCCAGRSTADSEHKAYVVAGLRGTCIPGPGF